MLSCSQLSSPTFCFTNTGSCQDAMVGGGRQLLQEPCLRLVGRLGAALVPPLETRMIYLLETSSRISLPKPGRAPLAAVTVQSGPRGRAGAVGSSAAAGTGGAAPARPPGSKNLGCPLAVRGSPCPVSRLPPVPAAERSRGPALSCGESVHPRAPLFTRPSRPDSLRPLPASRRPPLRKAATRRL